MRMLFGRQLDGVIIDEGVISSRNIVLLLSEFKMIINHCTERKTVPKDIQSNISYK